MTVELLLDDWSRIIVSGYSSGLTYLQPGQKVMQVKVTYDDGTFDYFVPRVHRMTVERVFHDKENTDKKA